MSKTVKEQIVEELNDIRCATVDDARLEEVAEKVIEIVSSFGDGTEESDEDRIYCSLEYPASCEYRDDESDSDNYICTFDCSCSHQLSQEEE